MKLRSFLAVVPRAIRIAAIVVAASLFAAGVIAGALVADPKDLLGPMGLYWTAALVTGALSGLWLLAVGYVFGDARLRGMRAALWTAVVILLPHLLGFLLYFVLRSPVLSACARCGMAISPEADFCPFCGSQQRKGAVTQSSPSSTSGIGDLL